MEQIQSGDGKLDILLKNEKFLKSFFNFRIYKILLADVDNDVKGFGTIYNNIFSENSVNFEYLEGLIKKIIEPSKKNAFSIIYGSVDNIKFDQVMQYELKEFGNDSLYIAICDMIRATFKSINFDKSEIPEEYKKYLKEKLDEYLKNIEIQLKDSGLEQLISLIRPQLSQAIK